ncbi:MAG: hypothetical protein SAL70_40695 [Scytonema sp. PMC 1070.18]|nr:hypothetical protein [Scytonema sp. PMC 1070.18]
MNIWIVTTGNSDVQLKNKTTWSKLYQTGRQALKRDHNIQPAKKEDDLIFTIPARVLGVIYGNQLNDEIYQDLCFPLLDAFSKKLQGKNQPDQIIVLLTNQEAVYTNPDKKCPYWKDTCTLKPILDKYFQANFPKVDKIEYLELKPQSKEEGLDNWDKALLLVQKELSTLEFNPLDDIDNIYVSHQAGTPAISSAIQFVSLSQFGTKVKFLLSNEYEAENTKLIESSSYLRGIQLQKAKYLLERFDYSGVESLLEDFLKTPNSQQEKLRKLLKIAIQWNCANFKEFAEELGEAAQERSQHWWWTGYEAAYLAVVRLTQGNTVEALFHSFRAVEGLICKWAEHEYKNHIQYRTDGSPEIKISVLENLLKNISHSKQDKKKDMKEKKDNTIILYSNSLYNLLKNAKPECKNSNHIMSGFWNTARKKRNSLFHRVLGLQEQQVFEAWDTKNKEDWKKKVLDCLNFVAEQQFECLQKASLMHQVHQDLEQALIDYELQSFSNLLSE